MFKLKLACVQTRGGAGLLTNGFWRLLPHLERCRSRVLRPTVP